MRRYEGKGKIGDGLPRQQVAFREKARKSEGVASLEGDFYTRFKPEK